MQQKLEAIAGLMVSVNVTTPSGAMVRATGMRMSFGTTWLIDGHGCSARFRACHVRAVHHRTSGEVIIVLESA